MDPSLASKTFWEGYCYNLGLERLTFSFREFLEAKGYEGDESFSSYDREQAELIQEYIVSGGYPDVVTGRVSVDAYIPTLVDSIVLTDVVNRYKVRTSRNIYKLFRFLLANCTKEFSLNRIKNSLNLSSVNTVSAYVGYLEESCLLQSLSRFSNKVKDQDRLPQKIYTIDNAILSEFPVTNLTMDGRLLENLVFVELVRRGYSPGSGLFYYRGQSQREVDFVVRKDKAVYGADELVQVSLELDREETQKRGLGSLTSGAKKLDCDRLTVVTRGDKEQLKMGGRVISVVPVWDWLLG